MVPKPARQADTTKLRSRLPHDLPRQNLGRQHRTEDLIDRFDGSLVVIGPEMRVGVQGLLSTGVAQPLLHHDHRAPPTR